MKILIFILLTLNLYAHQSSLALLNFEVKENSIDGSYKISIRDAHELMGLDNNFDTKITWKEILENKERLETLFQSNFYIQQNLKTCPLEIKKLQLDYLDSNKYLHFDLQATCPSTIEKLTIGYTLMFNKDANHKAYMRLKHQNTTINTLFSKEVLSKEIELKKDSYLSSFLEFIKEGIIHIFIGIDHILFLVALLLPSVLILQNNIWRPNNSLKATIIDVLKIVTAFTIAHSITLSLSILGVISLESWLIESLIAFSVILAGINNIFPLVKKRIWILVFIFGLIHGMGFASVLNELELANSSKLITLLGFNIGVELGQIAIVATLVPLIYLLREKRFYQPFVLKFGSFLIVVMGAVWFYERVTEGLSIL